MTASERHSIRPGPLVPPVNLSLGATGRPHYTEIRTPTAGEPEVEDIGWEPPHLWAASEDVMRMYLHRGDRVDIVEEDIDPVTESLKKHMAMVNAELQVCWTALEIFML